MKTVYGDDWLTADERAELAALRSKPRLSEYDQDDIDTFKQLAGLRSAIERMRKAGTLPKPYRVGPANNN
jgi:hypothetical protein